MKILHLLASSQYSGAENVVITSIKHYPEGCQGVYCSPKGQIERKLKEENVKFRLIEKLSRKEVRRIIEEEKPNLIHAHDFRASIIVASLNVTIPIISHLHNNPPWIKTKNMKTYLYQFFSRKYSKIFTVSKTIIDELNVKSSVKKKMLSVDNPIDFNEIDKKTTNIKFKDKKWDILFVGRLTEQKNPKFLMKYYEIMLKKHPDIKIAIVGDGPCRKYMEHYSLKKGLSENITFFGFEKNPYAYMKHSKLLVFPSKWEGFGLVAVEAMYLKVPVLGTPVGGLQEVLSIDRNLICSDIDDFLNKSNEILTNDLYRENLGLKLSNKVFEKYNISTYLDNVLKVYEEVLR